MSRQREYSAERRRRRSLTQPEAEVDPTIAKLSRLFNRENSIRESADRRAQLASKRGRKSKSGERSRSSEEPRAISTVGLPGSGKSTIARHMVSHGDTDQHEFDKSRKALGKGPAYFGSDLPAHTFGGAKKSAEKGRNTALTNTSIPRVHRKSAEKELGDAGYSNVKSVLAPGSTKAAMRRNRKRKGSTPGESQVPQSVMNRMAQGMKSLSRAERRELRANYKELHRRERFTKPAMKRSGAIREESLKTFAEFLEEARRRMRVLRTAHYTDSSTRSDMLDKGLRPGTRSDGAYHDKGMSVLYTTPSSRTGASYGTKAVHFKLINPKVTRTSSPKTYGSEIKNWMANASDDDLVSNKNRPQTPYDQARKAIRGGAKVIRVPDAHGGPFEPPKGTRADYILLDKELANRSIDRNPSPTISAKGKKPRRRIPRIKEK